MLLAGVIMLLSGASLVDAPQQAEADCALRGIGTLAAESKLSAMLLAAVAGLFAISIMSMTNRTFDIMQTTSNLYTGLFAMLAASLPGALGLAMDGVLLLVTILFCLMFMYTTYGRPSSTRRVYLIFTLLSAGAALQYSFAFYIPVMILGCRQMRCYSLRAILASIFGLITPYWILWGFSLITLDQFQPPHIGWPTPASLDLYSAQQIAGAGAMMIFALTATLYNLVKMYGKNARLRAFNGLLASLTLWTILAAIVDIGHLTTYMPLLAALTAINLTLYNQLGQQHRSYILVLLSVMISLSVFTWNLLD